MIRGLGVDLIELPRVARAAARWTSAFVGLGWRESRSRPARSESDRVRASRRDRTDPGQRAVHEASHAVRDGGPRAAGPHGARHFGRLSDDPGGRRCRGCGPASPARRTAAAAWSRCWPARATTAATGFVATAISTATRPCLSLLVVPAEALRGDPAAHLAALRGRRMRIEDSAGLDDPGLDALLRESDLLIDAIFGTGFRGPVAGEPARIIDAANRSGVPILAVDVPSGIDAETGGAGALCVRAAATVTMGLPKRGLMQYPAAAHAGRVYVADIGLPPPLVDAAPIPVRLATAAWVDRTLPVRPADGQKGLFGRVALVAGARGFVGAAILSARGAIAAGARPRHDRPAGIARRRAGRVSSRGDDARAARDSRGDGRGGRARRDRRVGRRVVGARDWPGAHHACGRGRARAAASCRRSSGRWSRTRTR